jgi:hypothetical protein
VRCYYQIDDGPWIKGHLMTSGQTTQLFPEDKKQSLSNTLLFRADCDCQFFEKGIRITSYMEVNREKNLYRLMTVDVSPGWSRHKWMKQ